MYAIVEILDNRTPHDIEALVALWQSSVKATHDFLSEHDILDLVPEVREGLIHIPLLFCIRSNENSFVGFLGADGDKVEMLFIDPVYRGKGYGKLLLSFAIEKYGITYVDVNEQNLQGVTFYTHMGFVPYKRAATDQAGRPFPLLSLLRKKGN